MLRSPFRLRRRDRGEPFGNLTREAFATLVEEMVGLGVFQAEQTRERVFLRNTNILLFLGSKSQIEDMLLEDRQEMRYDYKAHTCRGVAGRQGRDSRRRWLTRVEENKLFEPTGQLAYLSALPMAQSSTLSESLRAAVQSLAGGTMHDLRLAQPMDIETKLKSLSGRDASEGLNLVLIRINTWSKWDEFHRVANDFVKRPRTVKFYSLIVEVPPAFALSSEGAVFLANKNVTQFCARRWEREFVGPWLQESECTATHQQLDQVMDLTDGWPEFLHEFVRQHQETQRWDRAIEQTKQAMDLRFAQPSELMGKSFGLPSTKNRLIEAISELSRKGSASFSSGDFDVAAEITGLPPATIAYGVAQAAHYGLVVSNDSRHRCTPLFTRMLTAL